MQRRPELCYPLALRCLEGRVTPESGTLVGLRNSRKQLRPDG